MIKNYFEFGASEASFNYFQRKTQLIAELRCFYLYSSHHLG